MNTNVVLLTNVALEHTDVLGDTREKIAEEKLAVAIPGATVVLPDDEWRGLVPGNEVRIGGAREAAAVFLGHEPRLSTPEVELPGRLERRGPDEIRDGAHTPEGVAWLLDRIPNRGWVVVASILADKDVDAMLQLLRRAGGTLVATRSTNSRALDEKELAARAEPYFEHVFPVSDPVQALAHARRLGPVLVTGSLYLLADLHHEG
jgi:dihydrofolate synthase/folylpolyglutamate synthase